MLMIVAPLVGAWIEIVQSCRLQANLSCRSSRGSVDWNSLNENWYKPGNSRSSRGSVDWNTEDTKADAKKTVAPLVGAWIEIGDMYNITDQFTVAPLVGAWIEINIDSKLKDYVFSRSSRGSVDWNGIFRQNNRRILRRSSRGSVDWNLYRLLIIRMANWSLLSWERGLK